MSDAENDPVLDQVLLAARVSDAQLQTPEVLLAVKGVACGSAASQPRGGTIARSVALVGVAAVMIGVVGLMTKPTDEPTDRPGAGDFERVASAFPLPAGVTYAALKSDSMKPSASPEGMREEVALFSGCAWSAQLKDAELSGQIAGRAEITVALRRSYDALAADERASLTDLLDSVDKLGRDDSELRVTITQSKRAWDEICRDVR